MKNYAYKKIWKGLIFGCVVFGIGCGPKTYEALPDGAAIITYPNGAMCTRPKDFDKSYDANLELNFQKIINLDATINEKVVQLRQLSTAAQDIDSQVFRLCEAWGNKIIDRATYHYHLQTIKAWRNPSDKMVAISSGVELVNSFYDQAMPILTKKSSIPSRHRQMIEGDGRKLIVKDRQGNVIQRITAADLKKLSDTQLAHISVYERAAQKKYGHWKELYPKRGRSLDPKVNKEVEQELIKIASEMKGDLLGIFQFLESLNLFLDDHYLEFRDAIKTSDRLLTTLLLL